MTSHATGARLLAFAAAIAFAGCALAQQDYPNRPIRYILPYAPGGSTGFTARLVGHRLTEAWGQQVVVDYRAGANTMIGTEAAVRSKPDGYTLVYIGSVAATNHTLFKTPYDVTKDIAPIATIAGYENLLAVHPSLPVRTLKELIALAKTRPGELDYSTSSHGGSTHLGVEMLNVAAGIKTRQIPYKGGGPAVVALVSGEVHFILAVPVNVLSHVKNGRLRAIAVTGESRLTALPDVPTFTQAGVPNISLQTWHGVGAPAGTPKSIIDRISAEIAKLVATPDAREKLDSQGFVPSYTNPEQMAALLKADIVKYAKIIKTANIKSE
nr:tripartite tricarboxylate transporter family receptor [uncultured bacterium]